MADNVCRERSSAGNRREVPSPRRGAFPSALLAGAVILAGAVPGARAANAQGHMRYLADTYLESDGTQMIDTGYYAKTNSKFVAEFAVLRDNGTSYLFGFVANPSTTMNYGVYFQNQKIAFVCGNGWNQSGAWPSTERPTIPQRVKTTLDVCNRTCKIECGDSDTWTVGVNAITNNCTVPMGIFGHYSAMTGTATTDYSAVRLYSFAVYESDQLVMDLVPYGRGAVTGLLDRCTGKVHVNRRTGARAFKLVTDAGFVRSQRANTTSFNTGYCANPKTKIELDFTMCDSSATWQRVFGADQVGPFRCALGVNSAGYLCYNFQDDVDALKSMGVKATGLRRTFVLDGPGAKVTMTTNGVAEYTATLDPATITKTSTIPLAVFANARTNANGVVTAMNASGVKIHSLRIWDDGKLVRDYQPRIIDNNPGLCDILTGGMPNDSYWPNARLRAGGDIVCEATGGRKLEANADAYIESTGSQVIDTDCYLTSNSRVEADYYATRVNNDTRYLWGCSINQSDGEEGKLTAAQYFQAGSGATSYKMIFQLRSGTAGTQWSSTSKGNIATPDRFLSVCDLPNKKIYFITGATTNSATIGMASGLTTKYPITIFNRRQTAAVPGGAAIVRLYGFRIYESGTLTRDFIPGYKAGKHGLWELCEGKFYGNAQNTADFLYGGGGIDGQGLVFTEQPQACRLEVRGTGTLAAFAPGAFGYQWYCDGKLVEGAAGPCLSIEWSKVRERTYTCVANYAVFGYAESNPAVVTSTPRGLLINIR